MQSLIPPGLEFTVSRFAFGTGSLHHVGTRAGERLIEAAMAHGITHFDTAPYYGMGIAEGLLGRALSRAAEVTVATKVGLYPRTGTARSRGGMLLRKALGKALPPLSRPIADWTIARAKVSLDASLRRLKRDHVDLLLLHEPDRGLMVTEEWRRWLESESGRVRAFGLAGEVEQILPFLAQGDEGWALQTRDSVGSWQADAVAARSGRLAFTYGYLAAGEGTADAILSAALERRPGAIIVSTRRAERLALLERLAP